MINVLQWNAGRGLGKKDGKVLLRKMCVEREARVCLLQELMGLGGTEFVTNKQWTVFQAGRTAILVGQGLRTCENEKWRRLTGEGAGFDATAVDLAGIPGCNGAVLMISIYRDQKESPQLLIEYLQEVLLQVPSVNVIVGGDLNIHSKALGGQRTGPGGIELAELIGQLQDAGGGCANTGIATWKGRPREAGSRAESSIDATMYSSEATNKIHILEWAGGDQETSDHVPIFFQINSSENQPPPKSATTGPDIQSTIPTDWARLVRSKCTPERLAIMSLFAETTARTQTDRPGPAGDENAIVFASRVLGEIQAAAKKAGIIKDWNSQRQRAEHTVYGWSEECSAARKQRERAKRRMRRPGATPAEIEEQRQEWQTQSKRLKRAIKVTTEEEWAKFCEKIDVNTQAKEMWSRVRRMARTGKGPKGAAAPMMRGADGIPVTTARSQAQLLTDHWAARSSANHPSNAKFSEPAKSALEAEYDAIFAREPSEEEEIADYNAMFQNWELDKCIAGLPAGKAPGWDGIPYEVIAALGQDMRVRLLRAINGMWVTGGVPDSWKAAILIGIPKKAAPLKGEDYRPVSLLISICKLTEALIKGRLQWVLDGKDKALPPCDLGFRKHADAQQQVLRATQAAHTAWAQKKDLVLVQLDQDKAFDTMWGVGLIVKLFRYRVRGRLLRWIAEYMRPGRQGRTALEGEVSDPKSWDLGIGQGGVLGPILFVIFFSDFPITPEAGGKYADDSEIWMELSRNTAERADQLAELQGQLDAIEDWGKTWRMQASAAKTSVILFTPTKRRQHMLDNPLDLYMDGQLLHQTMEGGVRMLGVWLDPHLKFDAHIDKATARGRHRIQLLRQIAGVRRGISRETITHLYESWIRPVLEYGTMAYAGAAKKQLIKLDKVQAAALRIIVGTTSTASVEALHWEAGIQHLATRRLQNAATTASTLRRTRPEANSTAAEYQQWLELPSSSTGADRLARAVSPASAYERTGGRMSPFEIIRGAYRLLETERWDVTVELRDATGGGFLRPPWEPPQPSIPRNWPHFGPASLRSPEAQGKAHEYGQRRVAKIYREAAEAGQTVIMAYTDGSADPIRGGGGAAVIWVDTDEPVTRTVTKEVGHIATSFLAEGEALLLALKGVTEAVGTRAPETVQVHIWSDCQPAIRLVEEGRTGPDLTYWQVALTARTILEQHKSAGIKVQLDWIPAHCGLVHNEAADKAATAAAENSRSKGMVGVSVPRPHKVVRAYVRKCVNHQELLWFQTSGKARRALKLNPLCRPRDILPALRSAKLGRDMESCLGRLRVGNETGPRARIRMGMATDLLCRWCGEEDGTVHRLFECQWPTLMNARDTAKNRLASMYKGRYPFTLATLVGLWGVLKVDQAAVLKVLADMIREVPGLLEGFMETRRVVRPGQPSGRDRKENKANGQKKKKRATTPPALEMGQQLLTRYWTTTRNPGQAANRTGRASHVTPRRDRTPESVASPASPRPVHQLNQSHRNLRQLQGNEHLTQISTTEYRRWLAQPEDLFHDRTQRRTATREPQARDRWWAAPAIMGDEIQDWWNHRMTRGCETASVHREKSGKEQAHGSKASCSNSLRAGRSSEGRGRQSSDQSCVSSSPTFTDPVRVTEGREGMRESREDKIERRDTCQLPASTSSEEDVRETHHMQHPRDVECSITESSTFGGKRPPQSLRTTEKRPRMIERRGEAPYFDDSGG